MIKGCDNQSHHIMSSHSFYAVFSFSGGLLQGPIPADYGQQVRDTLDEQISSQGYWQLPTAIHTDIHN